MDEKLRILYIVGRFPCVSTVFQQNEVLGLLSAGVDLRLLSCRKSSNDERETMHDFARPLMDKVVYPKYSKALTGMFIGLLNSPKALLENLKYLLIALRNPITFPKAVAGLLISYGWSRQLSSDEIGGIHADFGAGTATVALMLRRSFG